MKKLSNGLSQTKREVKKLVSGNEENIFLVAGLILAIGVPMFFLWNPINFSRDDAQARSVLQAVEIPIDNGDDDDDNNNGGGNSGGGNNGGGNSGGGNSTPTGQPRSRDDYATIRPGQTVTVDVLANDEPRDGIPIDPSTFTITDQPNDGTIEVLPDKSIRYTPNDGVGVNSEETDTIRYTVQSENGQQGGGRLRITIRPEGFPNLDDDRATTYEDTPININVLNNDSPRDNIPLDTGTLGINEQPSNGTVSITPDNRILYTPNPGFFGNDEFRYQISSENGLTDDERVRVTVIEVPFDAVDNQPPIANPDTATTGSGTAVTIPVLANDFDQDGDLNPANTTIETGPTNGTAIANPDGTITYTPTPGTVGPDTLTYQITDDDGATATATVTIDVTAVAPTNQPPVANDDFGTTPVDTPITVDVLANDVDADNNINPDTLAIPNQPTNGTAIVNPNNQVIFTPNPGFTGTETFTYQISDLLGETDTATVTITVAPNPTPTANDDVIAIRSNESITVSVLGNDVSPESPLNTGSVEIITPPTNGTATVNPDGTIDYTPNTDYVGPDSYVYEVSNSLPNPQTDAATVSITVSESQVPVAANDTVLTPRNISVTVPILENDLLPGGTITSSNFVGIVDGPTNGTATFDSATGLVTYVPNTDYTGPDSFTYEISGPDGNATALALIDVQSPVGPNAVDDLYTINTDSTAELEVLVNDTPGSGELANNTLTVEQQPSNGLISVDTSTGVITYQPDAGFTGQDTFTYEIGNTNGEFDVATVVVDVVNDAPPAANDDETTTDVDQTISIPVLDNDFDSLDSIIPADTQIISEPTNGTAEVNPDGTVNYTPNPGYQGTDSFVYQIVNEAGITDVATATIRVAQTAPVDVTLSRAGQVLGASEIVDGELARTGGPEDLAANLVLAVGVMMSAGFFVSLYANKAAKTSTSFKKRK